MNNSAHDHHLIEMKKGMTEFENVAEVRMKRKNSFSRATFSNCVSLSLLRAVSWWHSGIAEKDLHYPWANYFKLHPDPPCPMRHWWTPCWTSDARSVKSPLLINLPCQGTKWCVNSMLIPRRNWIVDFVTKHFPKDGCFKSTSLNPNVSPILVNEKPLLL